MIVGNGDIASVLTDRHDRTYFASGISNSQETRESEYQREVTLLHNQSTNRHLVYFSSLSVFYMDTRYTRHKREMEKLVQYNFSPYTIIRLGNITWGTNIHTIINSIRNKILHYEPFEIQDVYRYLITKEEFLHWMDLIPDFSCEMNIIGRTMKVKDIVREYCYPWGKHYGTSEYVNTESQLSLRLTDSR